MTRGDILCEVVTNLFRSAARSLPLNGLGVVRDDDSEHAILTYLDPFGLTAYRGPAHEFPDALAPRVSGLRRSSAAELESNAMGMVESRLLHTTFADDIRHAHAVREVITVPVSRDETRMLLVLGLSESRALTEPEFSAIDSLTVTLVDLLNAAEARQADRELELLRRLEAVDRVLPALFRELDVRQIFDRVSVITKGLLPHDFASMALLSDDLTQIEVHVQTADRAFRTDRGLMPFAPAQTNGWLYRIIDDLSTHPLERGWDSEQAGGRSSIRVAIRRDDTILGAMNFTSREPVVYTNADLRVAHRIAEYVALAISHQQLAEESRRAAAIQERAANLELLDGLLGTLTGVLDVRDVFDRVSEIARRVLPHDMLGLPLVAEDGDHFMVYAVIGSDLMSRSMVIPITEAHRRLFTGSWDHIVTDDVQQDPEQKEGTLADARYRSVLRVAIRLQQKLVGFLDFGSVTPGFYKPADALIARRIADHIALALSHQRLAEESRRTAALEERAANLQMLDGMLNTLTGVLDIRRVFDRVSEIANNVLKHDAAVIAEIIDNGERVRIHASRGFQNLPTPYEVPMPDPKLLTEPWDFRLIDDVFELPSYSQSPAIAAGMHSMMFVPIRLEGRLFGGLTFYATPKAQFTRDDVLVARRIADHVALALSHNRLAEESRRTAALRQRTANLELLDELLTTISGSSELHQAFGEISRIVQTVLPHDALVLPVFMEDGKHARRYVTSGVEAAKLPDVIEIPAPLRDPKWEFDVIDDLTRDPAQAAPAIIEMGFRSVVRVPVRLEGRVAAGLGFLSRKVGAFTQDDVLVARRVADRVALSLSREKGLEASKRADEASARASRLEARVEALTEELNARAGFHRVVGRSPTWRQVLTQATQVAATDTTVLLLGESGTGKEVVARFLHRASTRKNGPFVALNCAALPEQLLESELFGYERGAFTGAMTSRAGKIEQAAGGVLFLDEVGEMTPPVQAKFLRVLQEREFQRLGGSKTLKADARVIAATNRDPKQAMERGAFREDLYYRLSVFEIALPPLRERKEDILLLVEAFLAEIAKNVGTPAAGVSEDAKDRLLTYKWPGNVRELRNAIERAVILCDGGLISSEHLPIAIGQTRPSPAQTKEVLAGETAPVRATGVMKLEVVERDLLKKAMARAGNNKSQAAKLLGVPRGQFYSLLKRHGLTDAKR